MSRILRNRKPGTVAVIAPSVEGEEAAGGETPDLYRFFHPELQIVELPLPISSVSVSQLSRMHDMAIDGLERHCRNGSVDYVLFACTSSSMLGGPEYDRRLIEDLMRVSGAVGATTAASAVASAAAALGVKRLSLLTPYTDGVNDLEIKYLSEEGIAVDKCSVIPLEDQTDPAQIVRTAPEKICECALKAVASGSQALFISCCGLNTFGLAGMLENRLPVPVLTSNQCCGYAVNSFFKSPGASGAGNGILFGEHPQGCKD